jgi:hypothetical protein
MSIVKIPVRDILPVIPFLAAQDVRYYLRGIFIEPDPNGGAVIVATNGHILAAIHSADAVVSQPLILEWSKTLTTQARSVHRASPQATVALESLDGRLTLLSSGKAEVHIHPGKAWIDAKYPDWRKVLPAGAMTEGLPDAYNPDYLQMALAAGSVLGKRNGVRFYHEKDRKDSVLVVRYMSHPELMCMVMPMNVGHMVAVPSWAKKPVIVEQAAA